MSIWCLNGYHFCFESSSSSFFSLSSSHQNQSMLHFLFCLIVHQSTNRLNFGYLLLLMLPRRWWYDRTFGMCGVRFIYFALATYLLKCEKIHDWTGALEESMKLKTLFLFFTSSSHSICYNGNSFIFNYRWIFIKQSFKWS